MQQFDLSETFDRNWAGPDDLKPRSMRNQSEKDIWYSCVVENEYRCPEFSPDDVVIDIGANIGGFSYMAYRKGSRSIYAFEIDPWNFEGMLANIDGLQDGIGPYHCAMVRGDEHRAPQYYYGGNWNSFGAVGIEVPSRSLDQIIDQVGSVRFLKIDCEGGEWPILYTCTQIERVQQIAGEYHLIPADAAEVQNLPYAISTDGLRSFLQAHQFEVEIVENSPTIGLFYASRRV